MSKKVKLAKNYIRAGFIPKTFDDEKRTVDVIFSTGAKVKRSPWFGEPYFEELSMKKSHVNLARFNAGAPVLNNHSNYRLEDIIGVVEQATIKDGEGHATVRFSDREDIQGIIRDIQNGIIRNVSVGYKINKMTERKAEGDEFPTYRAIDWEPMELSFVGIPADAMAQVRNEEARTYECEILSENEGETMPKRKDTLDENELSKTEITQRSEEEVKDEEVEVEEVKEEESQEESKEEESKEEASEEKEEDQRSEEEIQNRSEEEIKAAEKSRCIEIRKAVKIAKLDESLADEMIEKNFSVENARKEIFKRMEEVTNTTTRTEFVEVKDMELRTQRRNAAVRGILNAYNPQKFKLEDGDNAFRHLSILDTARSVLNAEGVRDVLSMSKEQLVKRALHHSSDFPGILSDAANKSLLAGWDEAPSTFEPFTRSKQAKDFKDINYYRLDNGGTLQKVNEHGEYKRSSMEEVAGSYKVDKYGEIIGNTFELMINDDLEAFTQIPFELGAKAKRTENETFWALVNGNQLMYDGVALFHADHGNLISTNAAMSIDELGKLRALLRLQTNSKGKRLNIVGRHLVVPPSLETKADQFTAQITPDQSGNVNPFQNLQKLVEPILEDASAKSFYMFADLAQGPMAEISRLFGDRPEIFMREGFDIDGMEMKIRHIFGMRIVDWRGFTKHIGEA